MRDNYHVFWKQRVPLEDVVECYIHGKEGQIIPQSILGKDLLFC